VSSLVGTNPNTREGKGNNMSKSTTNTVEKSSIKSQVVPFTTARITNVHIKECTLDTVFSWFTGPTSKELCVDIREQASALAEACTALDFSVADLSKINAKHAKQKKGKRKLDIAVADMDRVNALKKKVNALKAGLPYAIFAGRLSKNADGIGHRKETNVDEYTGLTQVDFDHVDIALIPEYVQKLSTHESAVVVFVSPSGTGVKVVAKIPLVDISLAKHKATYGEYQLGITKILANLAGIPSSCIDTSISDISRACYIPYDDNCYINYEATALAESVLTDALGEVSTTDAQNTVKRSGGEADDHGTWGGGNGERQDGYRDKDEFISMCQNFGKVNLSANSDTVVQNPEDGSVTYGWYVQCPSNSGHTEGDKSKSMVFFNEGADIKFPAGYKCFSPACEGHGWKWYAHTLGIPGQSVIGNMVERMNQNTAVVVVNRTDPLIARYYPEEKQWDFMKEKAFNLVERGTYIKIPKKNANGQVSEKKVSVGPEWLKHEDRRLYRGGIICDPTYTAPADQLNIFPGWGVEPAKGDWPLMKKHIRNVICDGDNRLYEWLMDWAAWPFHNLRKKETDDGQHTMQTKVAPVLQGLEGCGKGSFVQWMLKLYGPSGKHVLSKSQVVGEHSGEDLIYTSLLFADEALYAENNEVKNKLKGMVTEGTIAVNPKGKAMFTIDTALNIILASNEERVINVQEDNRRFCVLKVADTHKGDQAYFEALKQEEVNGGLAAWFYHLVHERNPTWANVLGFPKTKGTMEQQGASCSATYFFREVASLDPTQYGEVFLPTALGEVLGCTWDDSTERIDLVPAKTLFEAHVKFLDSERGRGNVNSVPRQTVGRTKFYALCDKFFGEGTVVRKLKKIDKVNYSHIKFPSEEALQEFTCRF